MNISINQETKMSPTESEIDFRKQQAITGCVKVANFPFFMCKKINCLDNLYQ